VIVPRLQTAWPGGTPHGTGRAGRLRRASQDTIQFDVDLDVPTRASPACWV